MVEGLNDNHRRALSTMLAYVDGLLVKVESAASSEETPFGRTASDLNAVERGVLADYVARVRNRMVEAARILDLPPTSPRIPAVRSILTSLTAAEIGIEEVAPRRLRGYGPVGEPGAALVASVGADLTRALSRIRTFLVRREKGDLAGRLARLGAAPFDLDRVRAVEDIVTRRGLVEFRPAIEALLERAETGTFEIALFGRVSSGKSSLINHLLLTDVLPVGVTPVTAVPTRLVWGEALRVKVLYADRPAEDVPASRIAEFVSEGGNPGNEKRVRRVVVEVPSPLLRSGIVLLDTPGVGSLAAAGARETWSYLPRCDLGIVLVAAGGALGREDVEIVRLLDDAGIASTVLVSKADLLEPGDRAELRGHVEKEVARASRVQPEVRLVSVRGGEDGADERGIRDVLEPLLGAVREASEAAARKRLAALEEGVAAVLRGRLDAATGRPADSGSVRAAVDRGMLEAEAILAEARGWCETLIEETEALGQEVLARSAARIERRLEGETTSLPDGAVLSCLGAVATEMRTAAQESLIRTREDLDRLLDDMAREIRWPTSPEPLRIDLVILPAFSPPSDFADLEDPRAWSLRHVPWWRRRRLRHLLDRQCGVAVEKALRTFAREIRDRASEILTRLDRDFASRAQPMQTSVDGPEEGDTEERAGIVADLAAIGDAHAGELAAPAGGE